MENTILGHALNMTETAPSSLESTFTGEITVTIDYEGVGPQTGPATIVALFAGQALTISSIAPNPFKTEPFSTPFGQNVTTVTVTPKPGIFDVERHISVPLHVKFDHSVDVPFYQEDSTLNLTLNTRAESGTPVDAEGNATAIGSGNLKDGYLNGKACSVKLTGRFTPAP